MSKEPLYFVAHTPKAITPQLLEFCKGLDSTQTPIYVEVRPHPEASERLCYLNVERAMNDLPEGGQSQKGWMIWEYPGYYACAEHHCVLRHFGHLVDVTPHFDKSSRILFLPSNIEHPVFFASTPVPRFKALADHPLLHKYVELQKKSCALKVNLQTNEGDLQRFYEDQATRCLMAYDEFLKSQKNRKQVEKLREQRKQQRRAKSKSK